MKNSGYPRKRNFGGWRGICKGTFVRWRGRFQSKDIAIDNPLVRIGGSICNNGLCPRAKREAAQDTNDDFPSIRHSFNITVSVINTTLKYWLRSRSIAKNHK